MLRPLSSSFLVASDIVYRVERDSVPTLDVEGSDSALNSGTWLNPSSYANGSGFLDLFSSLEIQSLKLSDLKLEVSHEKYHQLTTLSFAIYVLIVTEDPSSKSTKYD